MLLLLKIVVGASFIAMVVMNGLANALPLGGRTTGGVSAAYPTLFTPAGFTFSIWGLIYVVLGVGIVRFAMLGEDALQGMHFFIGTVFILSFLLNIAWLFAWHHDRILLSSLVMLALFFVLAAGFIRIPGELGIIRAGVSLYFAWISVAFIANITITLVAFDVSMPLVSDSVWLVLVLLVGTGVALATVFIQKDILFGAVFLWAFFGILSRHLASGGFDGAYPHVVVTLIAALFVIASSTVYQWIENGGHPFGG